MKKATLTALAALLAAGPAFAQLALSGNDSKAVLENGTVRVVQNPPADTITILDLGSHPPRVVGSVQAPHSVVGPPLSVTLTPDERLGLVTSAQKLDPANPARTIPDNRLSVIDLRATPPAVVQTLEAGAGASGVSVNRAGTLALVANRNAGTVSVYRIADGRLAPLSTLTIGPPASGVSHAQFTPDGRFALVTRDGDFMVTVLKVEGEAVTLAGRDITVGIRPYGLGITRDGRWAVVANLGRVSGDADTVSLVSLTAEPFRVADTISVGPTPEGIQVSPDGRHVAVVVINGSARAANHPLYGRGQLVMLRIDDGRLTRVAQAEMGSWGQGVVFNNDGTRVYVQNMVEREIQGFGFDGQRLTALSGRIAVDGGPSAFRTADR
ncbi:lactonase family protein [Sediminicoccus sp. KRV36]|uniref:lactonase family protein n=1 Tax=Sediminicoccus sp. KRV36 TaxID=3133721 RepID=UPI0020107F90|nr:lactonase family protein [Sediminicoccus rosea]UPY38227.1 lactonase family protein [Sediminicoccus rosea]